MPLGFGTRVAAATASPKSSGNIQAGSWAGHRGIPPSPVGYVEVPSLRQSRERGGARAQRPGVWIPRIPRPDKETETVARGWGRVQSPGRVGLPLVGAPAIRPRSPTSFVLIGAGPSLQAATFQGSPKPHSFMYACIHSFIHTSIYSSIPYVF